MLGAIQQPMILPALVTCALPSNYLRSLNKIRVHRLYIKVRLWRKHKNKVKDTLTFDAQATCCYEQIFQ